MKPTKTKKRIDWEKLNEQFAKENEQKCQKELMKPTKTKDFERAFYIAVDENNQLRDMLTKAKLTKTKVIEPDDDSWVTWKDFKEMWKQLETDIKKEKKKHLGSEK